MTKVRDARRWIGREIHTHTHRESEMAILLLSIFRIRIPFLCFSDADYLFVISRVRPDISVPSLFGGLARRFFRGIPIRSIPNLCSGNIFIHAFAFDGRVALYDIRPSPSSKQRHMAKSHAIVHVEPSTETPLDHPPAPPRRPTIFVRPVACKYQQSLLSLPRHQMSSSLGTRRGAWDDGQPGF